MTTPKKKTTTRTSARVGTPTPAGLSTAAADVLLGGGPEADTFYDDLYVLRKLADTIIDTLPRLPRDFAMSQASVGFAHTTCEPTDGMPDFDVPAIPGLGSEVSA